MTESFFLVLASNSNATEFEENTTSKFSNILQNTLSLGDEWGVTFRSIFMRRPHYHSGVNEININLFQIDKDVNDDNKQHLIKSIPYRKHRTDQHIYFETKRNEYYKLNHSQIKHLDIILCDQNNKQLRLSYGQPTIIKLKFKKMRNEHHILHLDSTLNSDIYKDNAQANFTNKLSYPLSIGTENWKVALSSMIYPSDIKPVIPKNTANNVIKDFEFYVTIMTALPESEDDKNGRINTNSKIMSTHFFDIETVMNGEKLLREFKEALNEFLDIPVAVERGSLMTFRHTKRRFTLGVSDGIHYILNQDLIDWKWSPEAKAYLYYSQWREKEGENGQHFQCLYWWYDKTVFLPSAILVYCNIISPIFFGNQKVCVLKMLQRENGTGDYIEYQAPHLDFIPIETNTISSITLQLKDISGGDIKFEKSNLRVQANLLFVKLDK